MTLLQSMKKMWSLPTLENEAYCFYACDQEISPKQQDTSPCSK